MMMRYYWDKSHSCKVLRYAVAGAGLALISACSAAPQHKLVGGDRDEHGCIATAGYQWCGRTQQCERPWELAKQQNFPNTAQAFSAFCSGK